MSNFKPGGTFSLAGRLHRAPNILLIPGTSSLEHLRENMQAARWKLPDEVRAKLDAVGLRLE
jgi:pyridoxine 4-dehydrogenase